MGQSTSQVQKITQKIYISNEITNKIENYLQNNITYVTRGEQNIEQTVKNIQATKSSKNTETNVSSQLSLVNQQELTNVIKNLTLVVVGSSDVHISQENKSNQLIEAIQKFDLNTINSTNIVLNNDANVVSEFLATTEAVNDSKIDFSSNADLTSVIENINTQTSSIEQAQTDTEMTDFIQKLVSGIAEFGNSSSQEADIETLQDVRTTIQNVLSTRNINNVESVTETLMSAVYSFHQENTVSNYQSDLEVYNNVFSTTVGLKMSNVIENATITIENSSNVTISQMNYAETQLYQEAYNTITRDNSFGNESINSVASHSQIAQFTKQKATVDSSASADSKVGNTTKNTVDQTAEAKQSQENTEMSMGFVIGIGVAVAIVVLAIIVGFAIFSRFKSKSNKPAVDTKQICYNKCADEYEEGCEGYCKEKCGMELSQEEKEELKKRNEKDNKDDKKEEVINNDEEEDINDEEEDEEDEEQEETKKDKSKKKDKHKK